MELKVGMVIMSHLSDAQELLNFDKTKANNHINFAKLLIMNYPNTDVMVTEETLNQLWQQVVK